MRSSRACAPSSRACWGQEASTRRGTSWPSRSTAGRTATRTSTTRSGIRSGSTAGRCRAWPRGSPSAGSRSPTRMPRRTPTRTRRSIRPTARSTSCRPARERRDAGRASCGSLALGPLDVGLARAPGERREVAVVAPRGVVPVDAESMQVAARGLCERKPACRRMPHVVEEDRLVRFGAGYAFDRDIEHARDRDRSTHPAHLELDRLGLGAPEIADQGPERRHRAAALAARDRRERVALLLGGALVEDEADRPVALDHRTRRVREDGEAQAVEPGVAVLAAIDPEDEPHVAEALGGLRRHPRRGARTHGIAAAGLEVFAADLPLHARHDVLQDQTLHPYIGCMPARRTAARPGRTATATPRSIRATPAVRAIHSPPGSSFSAATTAAMSSTQGSPIAPATTSTTISAQQQPRQ